MPGVDDINELTKMFKKRAKEFAGKAYPTRKQ